MPGLTLSSSWQQRCCQDAYVVNPIVGERLLLYALIVGNCFVTLFRIAITMYSQAYSGVRFLSWRMEIGDAFFE